MKKTPTMLEETLREIKSRRNRSARFRFSARERIDRQRRAGHLLWCRCTASRLVNWISSVESAGARTKSKAEKYRSKQIMKKPKPFRRWTQSVGAAALALTFTALGVPDASAQAKKPNILVIWGDDVGTQNISHNSKGMMGYRTPNIDRIAKEGVGFTDYYAQQSCTAG